ncbi:hypothetical protein V1508DRAFT_458134 [Lipomyces doorenjongii]|uniref:uncharacterized protein n=1 Tax=Lipomyces doorenjongii TaxID=383834 RepID=UPI0034CF36D8
MTSVSLPPNVQRIDPQANAVLTTSYDRGADEPTWYQSSLTVSAEQKSDVVNLALSESQVPLQPFVLYHDDFLKVLGPNPRLKLIAKEERYPFAHEAGVWIPDTREVFFTSNQFYGDAKHQHREIRISKIKLPEYSDTTLDDDEGLYEWETITPQSPILTGNGATNFDDGVLFCQQGSGSVPGALIYMSPKPPYATKTLLNNFYGRPFNAPNDVVVLPMDGSIWFTDPDYAQLQSLRRFRRLPNQVYCFQPITGSIRMVADGFVRPNGIAFSPDWKRCYITDTEAYDGLGNNIAQAAATVYVQDVVEQMSPSGEVSFYLANKRVFAFADCGAPDGIKLDLAGNVYCGCGDGVHVWNPSGTLIGKILVPRGVANLCFSDPGTIILLNETRIFEVKCASRGALVC